MNFCIACYFFTRKPGEPIHQAKGIEFETVFIAGVSEGEFPSFLSLKNGKFEEEKRLFYVAITRAKKHLFMSAYLKKYWNKFTSKSNFINLIPKKFIESKLENHLSST
jgi:DNA helicase-2/ATP-dependent DNA helicase PcrA